MPFDIAPVQVAFILIGENEGLINYYQQIYGLLKPIYRCQLYNKNKQVNLNILQADKEGCPLKIILGPEELEEGNITLKRRDNIENKITINKLISSSQDIVKKFDFFLVVSEVSKAGDFYHWPFLLEQAHFSRATLLNGL